MKRIENEKIDKIFEMYANANKLKTLPRTGWSVWKLNPSVRHESVAEHVCGCLMLATAVFSNVEAADVDVQKVFMMLAIHETEEIFIGDITPYQEGAETKKEQGEKAVAKFFNGAQNSGFFREIIAEFEQNESKEAKIAHEMDKFEACLQAKLYDSNFSPENSEIWDDAQIRSFRQAGDKTVSQFFLRHDSKIFDELFLQLAENIEKINKNTNF